VESVRPQAHTMDSTHSVRSSLFNVIDFENESELGKIDAPEKLSTVIIFFNVFMPVGFYSHSMEAWQPIVCLDFVKVFTNSSLK